jgi:hypothetical protein
MKYRRLTIEELEELRDEFVLFLASNSIEAAEWEKIKTTDESKMDSLLDLFSDMVIDKALKNISCLKLVSPNELYLFLFEQDAGKMIRFSISESSGLDLRDDKTLAALAVGEVALNTLSPELHKGNKQLTGNREEEMYQLLCKGAAPCERSLFDAFYQLAE